MTNIGEIAASLTEAQRRMLLRHQPTYGDPNEGWPGSAIRDPHSFAQAGRPMMDLGLISWAAIRSSETRLTPLGERVRDYLKGQG